MIFQVHDIPVLDSTQNTAHELARDGAVEGTLIQAREMTSGRGTHGRIWEAPYGNLYMSLILRPGIDTQIIGQLSFVAAIAVARAIEEFIPADICLSLKWPNDVLLGDKKLCGILIETELAQEALSYVVLGIGVNIEKSPYSGAICLQDVCRKECDVDTIRDLICTNFAEEYERWLGDGFASIREAWLKRAYRLGQDIRVSQEGGDKLIGKFIDLDEQGYLILSVNDIQKRLNAGGIELE